MYKKLIILTAPSGAGKTTILKKILEKKSNIIQAITYTTRDIRNGEKNGIDYFFVSIDKFKEMINNNEFLEFEEVYENQFYGSSKKQIDENHKNGKITIMIVDVKGAINIKEKYGNDVATFFIKVDIDELRNRLIVRNETSIEKRINKAKEELLFEKSFDYIIDNYDLDLAVNKILEKI